MKTLNFKDRECLTISVLYSIATSRIIPFNSFFVANNSTRSALKASFVIKPEFSLLIELIASSWTHIYTNFCLALLAFLVIDDDVRFFVNNPFVIHHYLREVKLLSTHIFLAIEINSRKILIAFLYPILFFIISNSLGVSSLISSLSFAISSIKIGYSFRNLGFFIIS